MLLMYMCRPEGMSAEEAAVIVLFSMELSPREASLSVLTNATLRNHQAATIPAEHVKYFGPYVYLLMQSLKKMPALKSNVVYKGVQYDLSNNEEYG
jgi:hypothetical protein